MVEFDVLLRNLKNIDKKFLHIKNIKKKKIMEFNKKNNIIKLIETFIKLQIIRRTGNCCGEY